jgi:thiamine-monophosphate kinase
MGEFDLISKYFTKPSSRALLGVGDDCAMLESSQGTVQCISSDMLVEGRHFFANVDPFRLGQKALAVNLSDLAACGATPKAFTLALALPSMDEPWLQAFSSGLWQMAQEHSMDLIGGDTTQGPLCICITIFGEVPRGQAILRGGARAGDDIYVSGTLGDAKLALEALLGRIHLGADALERVRTRLELPTPRVHLGQALRGVASSCIDLSDGLFGDLGHVLRQSGMGAEISTDWIRQGLALTEDVAALDFEAKLDLVMCGGDDYELLFTAPARARELVSEAAARSQTGVTRVGQITQELGLRVLDRQGRVIDRPFSSFDHFSQAHHP